MIPQSLTPPIPSDDAPIEVYFGSLSQDFGSAVLSKMFLRFWPYLTADGEQLSEIDFALLVQVIGLHQDGELRVSNLPMKVSLITRERTKARLRRMGLVFTQRVYYPAQKGKAPVMKCQRWDLRGLTYNLAQIAQDWQVGQQALLLAWESAGMKGRRPLFSFPEGYHHEVVLPTSLAIDIEKKLFYPIPKPWGEKACAVIAQLPTDRITRGRVPTLPEMIGRPTSTKTIGRGPTDLNTRGHLIEDDDDDDDLFAAVGGEKKDFSVVLEHFAEQRGKGDYQPSDHDLKALQSLAAEGILQADMLAGIDCVAQAGKLRQARSITYCFSEIRRLSAGSAPAPDSAPDSDSVSRLGSAPAGSVPATMVPTLDSASQSPEIPVLEIPKNVRVTFAQLFGRYPTSQECNQLYWLFKDHDQQAQEKTEDAWDWVLKATQTADPEAKKPVAYIRKVLEQQQKARVRPKPGHKSTPTAKGEPSKALAVVPQSTQITLVDGQSLRRPPKRSGYVIPSEVSQASLADAVAMMFPDLVLNHEE